MDKFESKFFILGAFVLRFCKFPHFYRSSFLSFSVRFTQLYVAEASLSFSVRYIEEEITRGEFRA